MKARIEYLPSVSFEDELTIESIGNTTLDAYNDSGFRWLLNITTDTGFSTIKIIGPFDVNTNLPYEGSFYYIKNYYEFKEGKLLKLIEKFVNDTNKQITQVFETEEEIFEEMLEKVKNNL